MHGWMHEWNKTLKLAGVAIPPINAYEVRGYIRWLGCIECGELSDEQKGRLSDQNLSSGAESGGDFRSRTNPAHRIVRRYS